MTTIVSPQDVLEQLQQQSQAQPYPLSEPVQDATRLTAPAPAEISGFDPAATGGAGLTLAPHITQRHITPNRERIPMGLEQFFKVSSFFYSRNLRG